MLPFNVKRTITLKTKEWDREQAHLRLDLILEDVNRRLELEGRGRKVVWKREREV